MPQGVTLRLARMSGYVERETELTREKIEESASFKYLSSTPLKLNSSPEQFARRQESQFIKASKTLWCYILPRETDRKEKVSYGYHITDPLHLTGL
ncbi:hypothetical protein RRG08_021289 [Elysia crispata]|uniref:Uncharacterized protein n=1 Tax=Elysia crispata TaxID=231223 RepID=A0AAE0ZAH9_9GAST|nr:hypothetical protein RRG08_021289 [Elysia crispata]